MNHSNPTRREPPDLTLVYMGLGVAGVLMLSFLLTRYSFVLYGLWKHLALPLAIASRWLSDSVFGIVLNPLLNVTTAQADSLVVFLKQTPASEFTERGFMAVNAFIGKHLLVVLCPVGLYAVVKAFRQTLSLSPVFHRFKASTQFRKYGLPIKTNASLVAIDSDDVYNGEMRVAMSCLQFCEAYNIVELNDERTALTGVDQETAYSVLTAQLGKPFTTQAALEKGELSVFVDTLINCIPVHQRKAALDFAFTGHLYETTVCLSLLFVAKRFGIVPVSQFLPLRQSHRALWYALISGGRKTIFVEGAAIMAQFEHELSCKMMVTPCKPKKVCVQVALDGILKALVEEPFETPWSADKSLWDNADTLEY